MSGIYGYMLKNSTNQNKPDLTRIEKWNIAYGNTISDNYAEGGLAVGCHLYSVNNVRIGDTPVVKRGNRIYVVDVLLYNPEELEEYIKKGEAYSYEKYNSYEELLVDYIEHVGLDALKNVNGDFAGAIIDKETWTVTLFRDHMGVRPLYYYADENLVVFSTDMRGLAALPQVNVSISEKWLFDIISGHSTLHPTDTEFAAIHGVTPASSMKFSFEEERLHIEEKVYWRIGSRKIRMKSEEEYQKELRRLITDSVRRRTQAVSGLIGAELSGGLDSSVIDILIHRLGREAVYFSWSVSPEELPLVEADERYIVKDICEQEGLVCHYAQMKRPLGEDSLIAENMRRIGMEPDQSIRDAFRYVMPPSMNTLSICETAQYIHRAGAKVVFTGHSGDEGVSHRCNRYEMFYYHEYYHYLRYLWSLSHGKRRRFLKTLRYCYDDLLGNGRKERKEFQFYYRAPEILSESFREKFAKKKGQKLTFAYDPREYIRSGGSRNRLEVTALLGAYSGVQYIFPYVDYRVIDYAVSIPRYLYLRGNQNRYIFRQTFKDIMPESLYRLKNKAEVSVQSLPKDDWRKMYEEHDRQITAILTREKWEKYIDFSKVDKWLGKGASPEEEREEAEKVQYCLFMCALFENVVTKVRES